MRTEREELDILLSRVAWQRCYKIPKNKLDLLLVKLNLERNSWYYTCAQNVFEDGDSFYVVVTQYGNNSGAYFQNSLAELVVKMGGSLGGGSE